MFLSHLPFLALSFQLRVYNMEENQKPGEYNGNVVRRLEGNSRTQVIWSWDNKGRSPTGEEDGPIKDKEGQRTNDTKVI